MSKGSIEAISSGANVLPRIIAILRMSTAINVFIFLDVQFLRRTNLTAWKRARGDSAKSQFVSPQTRVQPVEGNARR